MVSLTTVIKFIFSGGSGSISRREFVTNLSALELQKIKVFSSSDWRDDSTKTASTSPLIKRFSREIMSRAGLCMSDLRLVWITTRRSLHAAFVLSKAINAR